MMVLFHFPCHCIYKWPLSDYLLVEPQLLRLWKNNLTIITWLGNIDKEELKKSKSRCIQCQPKFIRLNSKEVLKIDIKQIETTQTTSVIWLCFKYYVSGKQGQIQPFCSRQSLFLPILNLILKRLPWRMAKIIMVFKKKKKK